MKLFIDATPVPKGSCRAVIDYFRQGAARSERVAFVDDAGSLSWAETDRRPSCGRALAAAGLRGRQD